MALDAKLYSKVEGSIASKLNGMISRSKMAQGYLNRVVYKQYQAAQNQRWMTENASEAGAWERLSFAYAKRKLKKFASYDGSGSKMEIATGRLQKGVVGDTDPSEHRKIVTDTSIIISTSVPYAVYQDQGTPFMPKRTLSEFSVGTMGPIYAGLSQYIKTGAMS
jgi:hypothetical protein